MKMIAPIFYKKHYNNGRRVLLLILIVFMLLSACNRPPEPSSYIWPPKAKVIPPWPTDCSYIFIRKPYSPIGYLLKDADIIAAIKEENAKVWNMDDGHGHYFMYGPGNPEMDYDVTSFGGGWKFNYWPFHDADEVKELAVAMDKAVSHSIEAHTYFFIANEPHKHGETMEGINSTPGLYAYYDGHDLTDQYSYVELSYSYDDKKGEYEVSEVLSDSLGQLACDDIFIPMVDYVIENSMLYQISSARCQIYGGGGFARALKIFLKDPISTEESARLEEMWKELLEKESYATYGYPYEYKEVTQYAIHVLSEQMLTKTEIEAMENQYNLKHVVAEPLPFQYLGSSSYDPSYISANKGYVMDTYFNWEHVFKKELLERSAENNGFTFNREIDFEKHNIIISYGREILEMQAIVSEYSTFANGRKELTVTFLNKHHGNEVFFYLIPKTSLRTPWLMSPYSIVENGIEVESGLSLEGANEIVEGFQAGF